MKNNIATKYPLPILKSLSINNYDLYRCPLHIDFSSKLNIVFGTNGLGKTTFLNILQYSVIGPYRDGIQVRNYKEEQKISRPIYDNDYFRVRMEEIREDAYVDVEFILGNDNYKVKHSLYDNSLISFELNDQLISGKIINYSSYEKKYFVQKADQTKAYLIYKYHDCLKKSSGFPDINALIIMMTNVMFFTEERKFIFWDEYLTKNIISKYFMDPQQYLLYEKAQQLVKKCDSNLRLKTYEMSFIKKYLGRVPTATSVPRESKYSLEDLNEAKRCVENYEKEISFYEKELARIEAEKIENRIQYENINRQISEVEKIWYKSIFPDQYQSSFNRYVPIILDNKCPFCGNQHDFHIKVDRCFFCNSELAVKKDINLNELEIKRKNLEIGRQKIEVTFRALNSEYLKKKQAYTDVKKLNNEAQSKFIEIKDEFSARDNAEYDKWKKLELEKEELTVELENAIENERKMACEMDIHISVIFNEYARVFTKYASSFFGENNVVKLELVGNKEERLFKFVLNGKSRKSFFDLSESQRIFVDLSFRLSLLEFFHNNSYFICETPDSTLDILFEDNAVKTFDNYIRTQNMLFLSANARNSNLINKLLNIYSVSHQNYNIVNLIELSSLAVANKEAFDSLEIYKFFK